MTETLQPSIDQFSPFSIEPRFVTRVWGYQDLHPWYDRTKPMAILSAKSGSPETIASLRMDRIGAKPSARSSPRPPLLCSDPQPRRPVHPC